MKITRILMLSILFAVFFMTACDDDPDPINEAEVLVEYLESADSPYMKDYVNTDMPSIIGASDVKTLNETDDIYIIDIRAAADYDTAHIENAVNVGASDVLTHIESVDLSGYTKVAIVCYTGQTAGWATSLLRIMGYDNAFSMKWGMCSWNSVFAGKWNENIGNSYETQFTTTATEKAAAGSLPELNTGETTGQEILEARVAAVFTEGFDPVKVTNASVFTSPDNYYIVNYWPADRYADPGHIPGAVQYTPKSSISLADDLLTLPTDKTIAAYCYTGQTSAFLAAYLRVLGYDAKSVLFGANGMIYDVLVEKEWTTFDESSIMGYEYTAD